MEFQLRAQIWNKLGTVEHNALRQTCHLFKNDIDNIVGVTTALHGPKAKAWEEYTILEKLRYAAGDKGLFRIKNP